MYVLISCLPFLFSLQDSSLWPTDACGLHFLFLLSPLSFPLAGDAAAPKKSQTAFFPTRVPCSTPSFENECLDQPAEDSAVFPLDCLSRYVFRPRSCRLPRASETANPYPLPVLVESVLFPFFPSCALVFIHPPFHEGTPFRRQNILRLVAFSVSMYPPLPSVSSSLGVFSLLRRRPDIPSFSALFTRVAFPAESGKAARARTASPAPGVSGDSRGQ